jgi:hypothetical protein
MAYSIFGGDFRSATPKLTKDNVELLHNDKQSNDTAAESVITGSQRMRRQSMDD